MIGRTAASVGAATLLLAVAGATGCRRHQQSEPLCPEANPPSRSVGRWQPIPTPRRLEGYVLDFETGAPRPHAVIAVPALGRHARPDSTGYFRFDSIPPGRHEVVTRNFAYHPHYDTVIVTADRGLAGRVSIDVRRMVFDACGGHTEVARPKPWWKFW